MSRTVMSTHQPSSTTVDEVLREVYHTYGFLLPEEAELIVAVQKNDEQPEDVTVNDYYANVLDPVRNKAKGMNLISWRIEDNRLVFKFADEPFMDKNLANNLSTWLAYCRNLPSDHKDKRFSIDYWLGALENSVRANRVGRKSAEKRRRKNETTTET